MRNRLLCGVASLAVMVAAGSPISAADLPLKAARVAPPPACMWCGLYVGGHMGYGWAEFRGGLPGDTLAVGNFSGSGFLVGLHAGYNWQFGRWLWGIEGDVTATPGWEKYRTNPTLSLTTDHAFGKLDALASIRGRLGMTFNRTLVYATGGVAFAKKTTEAGSDTRNQHSGIRVGGVVGGGIEWKYNPSFSVRLEGLHYIFDESRTGLTPSDGDLFQHGLRNVTTIRVGASWHIQPY
jgi:outer membrane immunogenic protein